MEMRMFRALKTAIMAALLAAVGLIAVPAVAQADSGDGKLACNYGEICLARDWSDVTYQRHFWYSGPTNGNFVNRYTGQSSGGAVANNASAIWNRDSSCNVAIIDTHWYGNNIKWFGKGTSNFVYMGDFNDVNDEIARCQA